jgi:transcriptional regulator with XRE-family HTH domain
VHHVANVFLSPSSRGQLGATMRVPVVVKYDCWEAVWLMPDAPSSPVRRALAVELRRLREQSGMSGDEAAERLGWSASKISRVETSRTGIKRTDLDQLLDLYEVDGARRSQLAALAAVRETKGWWSAYAGTFPAEFVAYIGLEDRAVELRAWSAELIHGLLQTEDYARAALASVFGTPSRIPPGEIQRRIDARLRRQELLAGPNAGNFTFVLDEATLRHRFGSVATMHDQLVHLDRLARDTAVNIRVLPFAGPHPVGAASFTVLSFAPVHGTALNNVVYMEHLIHENLLDDEAETYEYELAFSDLSGAALEAGPSRALIASVAREYWS